MDFLADLHLHSTFSDGKLSIPEIVDLFGKQGFGAISITDHLCETGTFLGVGARYLERTLTEANYPLYLQILESEAERAWKNYKMVVIPGFELTMNYISNRRSAHVLGIGIRKFISANNDPFVQANQIRETGAICAAAHPVHTRKREKQALQLWDRRDELSKSFDAWEVASGPYWFEEVAASGLPMIATSDMHHPSQMTSWKTLFSCERSEEAVIDAIRNQNVEFVFYEGKTT